MPLTQMKRSVHRVEGILTPVIWGSYDFRDEVATIPDESIRETLLETGVMFYPQAYPKIRVSDQLPLNLQSFSALHEELCRSRAVAPCPDVEEMVISAIKLDQTRKDYVAMRLLMFGALCMLDPTSQEYAETRSRLVEHTVEL